MKISFMVRKLEAINLDNFSKLSIKVKFGDLLEFSSAQQPPIDKLYPFLERNAFTVETQEISYLTIKVESHGKVLAQKTMYLEDAITLKKVAIGDYKLFYQLEVAQLGGSPKMIKLTRKKTITDEPAQLGTQQGKLQILKMGVLMYNFSQRLDPTIKIHKRVRSLIRWKNPTKTILFGLMLTLSIIYPKLSVGLFCLFLIFGKKLIIKQAAEYEIKENISTRLLLPEQNMLFLQKNMEKYCELFESVNSFLRSDDKKSIITLINIVCKLGFIILIFLLFFSLQFIIIVGLWIGLLYMSPAGKSLSETVRPKILEFNTFTDQILGKVNTSSIGSIFKYLNTRSVQVIKQFYIYEHQRWWVGRHWVPSHWSNQDRQIHILARKEPPKGWKWMEDWQIQYSSETDKQGYEYSHQLLKDYGSSKAPLKTLRRRKWTRKCLKQIIIANKQQQ